VRVRPNSSHGLLTVVMAAVVLLAAASCGTPEGNSGAGPDTDSIALTQETPGSGDLEECSQDRPAKRGLFDSEIPADALEDWVSFGDLAFIGSVKSIEDAPLDPEQEEFLEAERLRAEESGDKDYESTRFISKRVTVSFDLPIWERPLTRVHANDSIVFDAEGWIEKNGKRTEFASNTSPILIAGCSYLFMVATYPEGLRLLVPESAIPMRNPDIIGEHQAGLGAPPSAVAQLAGLTPKEASSLLAAVEPRPETQGVEGGVVERARAAGIPSFG
jgi:hypothetical protein